MNPNEVIVYDVDDLLDMTVKQLAVQIIARQDLFFPTRQEHVSASELRDELLAEANGFLASVESLGIPSLTDALAAAITAYEGGDE